MSATTWFVVALIVLAILPEANPFWLIRTIARYLLLAYVPGLAIWSRLKSDAASLVDFIVYPSLLSILPICAGAFGAIVFGVDLRVAGWIALILFVGIGFWLGWTRPARGDRGDRIAIAIAISLTVLLLVIPFAANSFQAVAWDGPLHAAIVSRILAGVIPPDSPMMAGQPVNYYWLYHFYSALLLRLTGLSVYQVFAALNVHGLILFVLAGYRVATRLTANLFGRLAAAWMLVFGLNAFGWVIFLAHGSQNPDRWYSLVVPFAMVRGFSLSLGSLIHEFMDGFPFVTSFALDVAWLDVLVSRAAGERGRTLVVGALVMTTALYLHPLSAVFLAAASLVAVVVIGITDRRTAMSERRSLVIDVALVTLIALIAAAPYGWDILHGKTAAPLSLTPSIDFIKGQVWSIVATIGLMIILAGPALWNGFQTKSRAVLISFAATTVALALIVHVTLEAEYKLIYLLGFAVGPLIAPAWEFWRRNFAARLMFICALVVCIPTNAITSYCFAAYPPRETREPARTRLMNWIREKTPPDSIVVENPWWEQYQTTDAAFLYLDRYYFDVAVYGHRRQLIGYGTPMLEQWGYRDIKSRNELMKKLVRGRPLESTEVTYLASLHSPVVVVTNASALEGRAFDSANYTGLYQDGDIRAYRVTLPANSE